jgi:uncharacterized repeat protein (TIGR04138 family)
MNESTPAKILEIVFNMVDHGLLSKTEQDSRDDFKGGYDFYEAFCRAICL